VPEAGPGQNAISYPKKNPEKYLKQIGSLGIAQVIEHLPSKCKALSSNPYPGTKGKENKQKNLNHISKYRRFLYIS
jgi:hypothetical protein